jgi:hypothetical protein
LYSEGKEGLKTSSIWWRDLWRLGGEDEGGWFGSNISNVLGDGKKIGFWKEKWLGLAPLRDMYPTLFNKSNRQDGSISEMGLLGNNGWSWNLPWTDALSAPEAISELELQSLLVQVQSCIDREDRRRWIPSTAGYLSVKSAYVWLQNRLVVDSIDDNTVFSLKKLWKNNVPSKVSIFGWRLLLEKLPTREALFNKGVITNHLEKCCVFCFNMEESLNHCFIDCHVTATVWREVLLWMGTSQLFASNVQHHFLLFVDLVKGKNYKCFKHLIVKGFKETMIHIFSDMIY